jgi:predicted DNA-binding transcriptional regulator YafY
VHLTGRWFLVAWDTGVDAWRSLPVDRITGMPVLDRRFQRRRPPAGGYADYVARGVSASRDRHQARIVLHSGIAEMLKRVPPEYGTLEPIDDDHCLLRTGHAWLGGIAIYVSYIGVDFTVLDPPELGREVRRLAARFARASADDAAAGTS